MERIQKRQIKADLNRKMVFITGPRQAGKTWLAQAIAAEFSHAMYLNYDAFDDRQIIQQQAWLDSTNLLILDELHKMPGWKDYLKGVYDTKPKHLRIIVTGSARLDITNQIGDSLAGRYFIHRLLPLSHAELAQLKKPVNTAHLIERSGFPEPYLAADVVDAKRWRLQYSNSLIREDVFAIDNIQKIKSIQLVFELLRRRVGSPVSYQSIAEDSHLSHNTVKKYIQIFEALYLVFRVTPFSKNIARSLLKEPKIYFFDTGLVMGDPGVKLENLVACSLLKHVYAKQDYQGEDYSLHYLRTKEGKEVDFALVYADSVQQMIEVKHADHSVHKSLAYFQHKYQFSAVQLVQQLKHERQMGPIQIRKLENYLQELLL